MTRLCNLNLRQGSGLGAWYLNKSVTKAVSTGDSILTLKKSNTLDVSRNGMFRPYIKYTYTKQGTLYSVIKVT